RPAGPLHPAPVVRPRRSAGSAGRAAPRPGRRRGRGERARRNRCVPGVETVCGPLLPVPRHPHRRLARLRAARRSEEHTSELRPYTTLFRSIVQPDHYILRLLYARGVPLEALGVPRRDRGGGGGGGSAPVETDACQVWKLFADHYYLFRGTPTGAWLDYELH